MPNGLTQKWSVNSGSRAVMWPATPSEKPNRPNSRSAPASLCLRCRRSSSTVSKAGGVSAISSAAPDPPRASSLLSVMIPNYRLAMTYPSLSPATSPPRPRRCGAWCPTCPAWASGRPRTPAAVGTRVPPAPPWAPRSPARTRAAPMVDHGHGGRLRPRQVFEIAVMFGPLAVANWRYEFEDAGRRCRVTESWLDQRKPWMRVVAPAMGDHSAAHAKSEMAATLANLAVAASSRGRGARPVNTATPDAGVSSPAAAAWSAAAASPGPPRRPDGRPRRGGAPHRRCRRT